MYILYKGDRACMSKGLATRLKKLFDQGTLDFVFDTIPISKTLETAFELATSSDAPQHAFEDFAPTATGRSRVVARTVELLRTLPPVEWRVSLLEKAGIPTKDALDLMANRDLLLEQLSLGKWNHRDLTRLLESHYRAAFAQQELARESGAPPELVAQAALFTSRGVGEGIATLEQLGRDVLRYEIWRGENYLSAFLRAQRFRVEGGRQRKNAAQQALEQVLELRRTTQWVDEEANDA
jgi:hypothetical protein